MTGAEAAGGPRVRRGLRSAHGALLRVLVMLLSGLVVLLAPAAPASAHAALLGANPAPGSVVGNSPAVIHVTFSEPITPVAGRVQVLAPDGKRISGTATSRGAILTVPVRRADRPLGTYLVSYRVISADSHPVAGGFTFSVGAPSATPPEADTEGVHRSVALAVPTIRFLGYAGLTLAVGPALLLGLLWPRRRSRRGATRLAYAGLGLTGIAALAGIWVQAPYSSGAPISDVSLSELGEVLTSGYGVTLAARLAALAAVAALLPPILRGQAGRARVVAVIALGIAGLTTWPLTGHAIASPLPGVIVAADVVHMAAMTVWLGGLITLSVFLLRGTHPRVLGKILPAWSRWAAIAVVWLVGGGVLQAVVQVGSIPALWQTGYGRLLTAKVAILVVTLGVAAHARRLVNRAQVPAAGTARLRRTVGIEVAATAVVLGLSAVLVQVNPGRSADTDAAAVVVEDGVSQTLTSPLYTLQFNIFPVQVGENNTIHAFLYTPEGKPLPAEQWTVTALLTGQDLEPVTMPLRGLPAPRHHALGAITFALPGTYELRFTIRVSEIDQATVRTTVDVPGTGSR